MSLFECIPFIYLDFKYIFETTLSTCLSWIGRGKWRRRRTPEKRLGISGKRQREDLKKDEHTCNMVYFKNYPLHLCTRILPLSFQCKICLMEIAAEDASAHPVRCTHYYHMQGVRKRTSIYSFQTKLIKSIRGTSPVTSHFHNHGSRDFSISPNLHPKSDLIKWLT